MSKKNNIENLFKEKMLAAEVKPPVHAKRAIDDALNFPKTNVRRLFLLTLLLLSLLSASAYFFLKDNNSLENGLSDHKITTHQSRTVEKTESEITSGVLSSTSKNDKTTLNEAKVSPELTSEEVLNTATTDTQLNNEKLGATKPNSTKVNKTSSASEKLPSSSTKTTHTTQAQEASDSGKENTVSQNSAQEKEQPTEANGQKIENGERAENTSEKENANSSTAPITNGEQNVQDSTVTELVDQEEEKSEDEKSDQEKEETNKEKKEKSKASNLLTGYGVGIDVGLPSLPTSREFTELGAATNTATLNYQSIIAYQIYGLLKAYDQYNLQLGAQFHKGNTTYAYDSSYTNYFQYIDTTYVYDTFNNIIDTNYTTYNDSTTATISNKLRSTVNYFNLPISVGRTFILNPNGNENIKLTTNLGADLRFTRLNGDIEGLIANPFTVNFMLRNTLAYEIGNLDIILPIQVNYNPKSRLIYQETRIDPKTSFSLGLGIQYNF
ncbi:hypothetical protein SAMN05216474_0885 [Lishizhenia tianjinensis]|uniref:Outer membrane protein beta-barrel domain-containing protein n=1 Tax=Lishizhenia tianjinensis TaxID=477690 RepID=A0A1I6YGE3_9FLAO|nr:hypothetical protein [Lishizhenia tianjinensis]SFT49596.1 hypothetical protein SAMN05216474_0885 [Lishizhenia tianjinensis]